MLRNLMGEEFIGPKYLDIDTGEVSTRWWKCERVSEEKYPYPLVTFNSGPESSHKVLVKNEVVKFGTWSECAEFAELELTRARTNKPRFGDGVVPGP